MLVKFCIMTYLITMVGGTVKLYSSNDFLLQKRELIFHFVDHV